MNRLFDIDGPVMGFLTKVAYCAYLNVLWFLCCLPVVTVGASTTALFYVTIKIARNEEGHLTRAFFHSFKENFRQSTVIWLIMLGLGIVLGVDGYVFYHMRFSSALWTIGTAAFLVAVAGYCIVLMYIFPLVSHFENTTRAMFKNSIMIGMRFLYCTALMAAIYFAMAVVIVRIFTPAVIFGEGCCALLCSYLLSNVLTLCEGPRGEEAEDAGSAELAETDSPEMVSSVVSAADAAGIYPPPAGYVDGPAQTEAESVVPGSADRAEAASEFAVEDSIGAETDQAVRRDISLAMEPEVIPDVNGVTERESSGRVFVGELSEREDGRAGGTAGDVETGRSARVSRSVEDGSAGAAAQAGGKGKRREGRPDRNSRLRDLHGKAKLQYIWDYYKLPMVVICIGLYIVGYLIYGHFTHKDTLLNVALVNMEVGEDLTAELSTEFLEDTGRNAAKEKLELYTGLYLTGDADSEYYDYVNASRTRIVGSIDREALDVVLMNREAFDAFSQSGYLLNIETFLKENDPQLLESLQGKLVSNIVILEDNALDVQLDPTVTYDAETEEYPMGIDLSDAPRIEKAGMSDTIYLGIIANTPRAEEAAAYLDYLCEGE